MKNRPDNVTPALKTIKNQRGKVDIEAGLRLLEAKYGPKPVKTYIEDGKEITVYR